MPIKKIEKQDYSKIKELYKSGKTLKEISKIFKVKSETTIWIILKKLSVNLRKGGFKKGYIPYNKNKRHTTKTKEKMSQAHSGKYIGKSWGERYGKEKAKLMKRKLSKNKKGIKFYNKGQFKKGKKHPSWKGGISFEPYDEGWTKEFRKLIRKRDNQICMLCGIHREKLNRALGVHHVNYNKLLTIPQNCISLCSSCHQKTNFNEEHWIKFFQDLLSKRYNYVYSKELD